MKDIHELEELLARMFRGLCYLLGISETGDGLKYRARSYASVLFPALRESDSEELLRAAFSIWARRQKTLPRPCELLETIESLRPVSREQEKSAAIDTPRDPEAVAYGEHLTKCFKKRMTFAEAISAWKKMKEDL